MQGVGMTLLTEGSILHFFQQYVQGPTPDVANLGPIQAVKQYTEECGGDSERTLLHLAPPPPQLETAVGRRRAIKCVTRDIVSSTCATAWHPAHGIVWTTLLCCWDDPYEACMGGKNL